MILLVFLLIGMKNGVIREAVLFVGIIVVFVISYMLKDIVGNFLCLNVPFIKFTGSLSGLSSFNILVFQTIAFLAVFSLLLGIYAILVKTSILLQKVVNFTIVLILPSKLLGGLIGFLKGWLFLFMVLLLLMLPLGNHSIVRESKLTKTILYKTPIVSNYTEKLTSSIKEVFETVHRVKKKEISSNEANIECLDIMLKYKVVSKETVKTLIDRGKLERKVAVVLENY